MNEDKLITVPQSVLQRMVELINLGQYPSVTFGTVNNVLEGLRKSVQDAITPEQLAEKDKKIKELEEKLTVKEEVTPVPAGDGGF